MPGQPRTREVEARPPAPGARAYSWPPFAAGHTLSTRHGVYSERRVLPIAQELAAGLLAERPDLERYPEQVHAWARAEAVCLLVAEFVVEHGLFEAGELKAVMARFATFERLALEHRRELGLTPRGEAELVRDRAAAERGAADVEELRAQGRRILEAQSAADDSAGIGVLLEPPVPDEVPGW